MFHLNTMKKCLRMKKKIQNNFSSILKKYMINNTCLIYGYCNFVTLYFINLKKCQNLKLINKE